MTDRANDEGASAPPPAEAKRLFRNSVFLALGKVSVAFTFLLFIFAARRLGASGFGEFTLSMTIAAVLATIPRWGTNQYSAIMAARSLDRTPSILAENLGLKLLLSFVYIPASGLAAQLISGNPRVVVATLVLTGAHLAEDVGQALRLLFRAHDVYLLETVTSTVERIGVTAAGVVALLIVPTPEAFAVGILLGRAAGAAAAAGAFWRRISPIGISFRMAPLRRLFVGGTPIALRSIIAWANLRVDMLVLGALAPSTQLGWYGAVYKLVDGTMMVPSVVQGSLAPTLSASFGAGRHAVVERLYRRGVKYLVILALFIASVFVFQADLLMRLIFGAEYVPGAISLQILGGALVFTFLRQLAIEVMDNVDVRRATVKVFFVILLLNTALNLILVPRYGHAGAASATLIAEAALAAGLLRTLRSAGYSAGPLRQVLSPALAILPAIGVLWLLRDLPVAGIAAAGTAYLLALTLLGIWDAKDRSLARDLMDSARRRLQRIQ